MAIIEPERYDEIRAVLDVSFNDQALPNDIIEMPIFYEAAEQWVLDNDANALTRTGTALKRIERATIYKTAALIAPAVPNITSKALGGQVSQSLDIDWDARADLLHARADSEIDAVVKASDETPSMPTMFAVASGTRGW